MRFLRSRPVRFVLAAILVAVIFSPAAVVGAVVWTVPPPAPLDDYQPTSSVPERMLPPADVIPGQIGRAHV